jgi:hypothetical protein
MMPRSRGDAVSVARRESIFGGRATERRADTGLEDVDENRAVVVDRLEAGEQGVCR